MAKQVIFKSLSSGSCGNCYFLGLRDSSGKVDAGLVIDAGVSVRRFREGLKAEGLSFDDFQAVIVTHDHNDHIRHLGSFCKHIGKPVYATAKLHGALATNYCTRDFITGCRKFLNENDWTVIVPDKISVRQFEVPHDATQTVGYAIVIGGYPFVIMTDVGAMTPEALAYASNARTVVIESNYDMDMLMSGPYTHELKMRICQGNGHLSNDQCAEAVKAMWHTGLEHLFLCHLSENNNTPELAFRCTEAALRELGVEAFPLHTLPRRYPSQLFVLAEL